MDMDSFWEGIIVLDRLVSGASPTPVTVHVLIRSGWLIDVDVVLILEGSHHAKRRHACDHHAHLTTICGNASDEHARLPTDSVEQHVGHAVA
eukprot:COSAG01_NODE_143_length_24153_cov_54.226116_11_plen_92_part_00